MFNLQEIFNLLPNINDAILKESFTTTNNDIMLTM